MHIYIYIHIYNSLSLYIYIYIYVIVYIIVLVQDNSICCHASGQTCNQWGGTCIRSFAREHALTQLRPLKPCGNRTSMLLKS